LKEQDMTSTLYAVSLDCSDARELATFWSAVLDRPVDDGATAEFAAIGLTDAGGHPIQWMFHQVPEGKAAKNRFHPDLVTSDLDGEVKRIVDLGAVQRSDVEESGYHWVTLIDPQGNEFDVIAT
jgi:predicted enzyme related to lactoylglutathione lyase